MRRTDYKTRPFCHPHQPHAARGLYTGTYPHPILIPLLIFSIPQHIFPICQVYLRLEIRSIFCPCTRFDWNLPAATPFTRFDWNMPAATSPAPDLVGICLLLTQIGLF
jgi:hypothetical protein